MLLCGDITFGFPPNYWKEGIPIYQKTGFLLRTIENRLYKQYVIDAIAASGHSPGIAGTVLGDQLLIASAIPKSLGKIQSK